MSTNVRESLAHVSAISLFVEDLQTAKSFYEAVFGVDVVFEDETSVCVKFDQLFVNLLLNSSAEQQASPRRSPDPSPALASSSASGSTTSTRPARRSRSAASSC